MGIHIIPMSELQQWLKGQKSIPKRAAVLTFDDAYESVFEYVFPYLKKRGIPMTIFVIADFIGGKSNLYGQRGGRPRRHLNLDQLKTLLQSGLVEVGAHGYRHLNLTRADDDQLRHEICTAKALLEDTLKLEVPYFAYPYGGVTERVSRKVEDAGYRMAFTTRKKKLTSNNIDLLRIPRVNWSRGATLLKLSKYYLIPWIRAAG